jgi:hypothetical protein
MRVRAMTTKTVFKPKMLAVMLAVCGAIAGIATWITGLNFWILLAICVVAVLLNGLVATIEDKNKIG